MNINEEADLSFLEDIEIDDSGGVTTEHGVTPDEEEYGDMLRGEQPEDDDEEAIDHYLNMELIMDVGTSGERRGRVIKRSRGLDGEPIGRAHTNPLFDTREYDIEFTDGAIERYTVNVIAENMFAQVDEEGNMYMILQEIVDHKRDNSAMPMAEGMYQTRTGSE